MVLLRKVPFQSSFVNFRGGIIEETLETKAFPYHRKLCQTTKWLRQPSVATPPEIAGLTVGFDVYPLGFP